MSDVSLLVALATRLAKLKSLADVDFSSDADVPNALLPNKLGLSLCLMEALFKPPLPNAVAFGESSLVGVDDGRLNENFDVAVVVVGAGGAGCA